MAKSLNLECTHYLTCSGCELSGDVSYPPLHEEMKAFFEKVKAPFDYKYGSLVRWRTRAKLSVRGNFEKPLIGLYEKKSHHVVEIPFCEVHHPSINQAVKHFKDWMITEKIAPYDEEKNSGLIRYLQFVVERKTGKVQLTIVVNAKNCSFNAESLWQKEPSLWHSLWININTDQTNTIFGKEWSLIRGDKYIKETIAEKDFFFHPTHFAQANLDMFEVLLKDLQRELSKEKKLLEYYAGIGVIGCCLSNLARSVVCAEINPFAEESFIASKKLQKHQNVEFITGSAEKLVHLIDHQEIIIVDPPRKGLDIALLEAINRADSVEELWYMSCGWKSFQKDCKSLEEKWELKKAFGYLFFPGTNHIETLALFKRKLK